MAKRTHYRNAYKSDHLASADLEEMKENGKKLILTIDRIEYFSSRVVAGRKIKCNIAFFKEQIKPLVVNARNADILQTFIKSSFIEDWTNLNLKVELYVDYGVKFQGHTSGIRIKKQQPAKPKLPPITGDNFKRMVEAIKNKTYTIKAAKETYSLTKTQLTQLK